MKLPCAKKFLTATSAVVALSASLVQLPAVAVISLEKINDAIAGAKILSPEIGFRLASQQGALMISTYRSAKAEEKDCKIEAILLAKTAMSTDPDEIARVTVDFNSTAGSGKILRISVTAGDVKAFGEGSVGKDELLRSIKTEMLDTSASARVTQYVDSSMPPIPTNTKGEQSKDEYKITANLAGWASERDTKYQALLLATRVEPSVAEGTKTVRIDFIDPENAANLREVVLTIDDIKALSSKVSAALKPIGITTNTKKDLGSSSAKASDNGSNKPAVDSTKTDSKK